MVPPLRFFPEKIFQGGYTLPAPPLRNPAYNLLYILSINIYIILKICVCERPFSRPRHHKNPKLVSIEHVIRGNVPRNKFCPQKDQWPNYRTKCYTTNAFLWQMFILNNAIRALLEAIKVLYFCVHWTDRPESLYYNIHKCLFIYLFVCVTAYRLGRWTS